MNDDRFEAEFWEAFDRDARPALERACATHLRRTGGAVDLDDMISWASCRVWKLVRERPNAIVAESATPSEAVRSIVSAAPLLARWAYLAHIRRSARISVRERNAEDIEAVRALSAARAEPAAFEQREDIRAGLDSIRQRAGADLRAKLAASWRDPADRARIGTALGAQREQDQDLRDRVARGDIKENTVQQMRSRSLRAVRALFDDTQRLLSIVVVAGLDAISLSAANAKADNDDDGGEQTGGRSAHQFTPENE